MTRAAMAAVLFLLALSCQAESRMEVGGGVTVVGQGATDDRADEELTASADLFLAWTWPAGWRLDAYIEANTSLQADGVSALLVESNADAGTALDPDRGGRLQLSELKASRRFGERDRVVFGLLDASAYLDTTRINNDENMQFVGASFVNNPTIEFPDYSLGAVWGRGPAHRRPGFTLVVAGSHGIADNPNLSYSQLLSFDDAAKGVFVGFEADRRAPTRLLKTGGWFQTASHSSLDGRRTDATHFGAYGALGQSRGKLAGNLRFGLANPEITRGSAFVAVSLQLDLGRRVLGLGLSRTFLSPDAERVGLNDGTQIEAYVRFQALDGLYVTPSLQHLKNSDLDSSGELHASSVRILGVRLHYTF